MQQLVLLPSKWIEFGTGLQAHFEGFPQQHEFAEFANRTIERIGGQILSHDEGADRVQLHFLFKEHDWLMCFEGTCEAVWIEPIGLPHLGLLEKLSAQLKQNTDTRKNAGNLV